MDGMDGLWVMDYGLWIMGYGSWVTTGGNNHNDAKQYKRIYIITEQLACVHVSLV